MIDLILLILLPWFVYLHLVFPADEYLGMLDKIQSFERSLPSQNPCRANMSSLNARWNILNSQHNQVIEGEPTIIEIEIANSWLILNTGGGPTDDKPTVTLHTPQNPNQVSNFMNIRVAVIRSCYEERRKRGAEFLTEPKDHRFEIRCYMRDPDGYIIEVGQSKSGSYSTNNNWKAVVGHVWYQTLWKYLKWSDGFHWASTFGFFTVKINESNSIYLMAILNDIVVRRLRLV